jgi:hypothetical protein
MEEFHFPVLSEIVQNFQEKKEDKKRNYERVVRQRSEGRGEREREKERDRATGRKWEQTEKIRQIFRKKLMHPKIENNTTKRMECGRERRGEGERMGREEGEGRKGEEGSRNGKKRMGSKRRQREKRERDE